MVKGIKFRLLLFLMFSCYVIAIKHNKQEGSDVKHLTMKSCKMILCTENQDDKEKKYKCQTHN